MVVQHRMNGVHKMVKTLASGKVVEYHYAWRGGPRIIAKPGTKAYLAEYMRLTQFREQKNRPDTVGALIEAYRKSEVFTKLSPTTVKSYSRILDQIKAKFADIDLIALEARGARTLLLEWLGQWRDTARMADLMTSVFARLLSFGVDREHLMRNPLTGVKRLSKGSRRDNVWPVETIKLLLANGKPYLVEVAITALWTMQRQSDCLAMTPLAFDGTRVRIRQFKTGALVRVKPSPQLEAILRRATERRQIRVHLNSEGQPWTSDGFRASWQREMKRLGISGLTFHDLRGSGITYAYAALAATMPRKDAIEAIATISGHSATEAEKIISRYYLAGEAVVSAIQKAIA